MKKRVDPIDRIEKLLIKITALLCLLHTLYEVIKYDFGFSP